MAPSVRRGQRSFDFKTILLFLNKLHRVYKSISFLGSGVHLLLRIATAGSLIGHQERASRRDNDHD